MPAPPLTLEEKGETVCNYGVSQPRLSVAAMAHSASLDVRESPSVH